MPASTASAEPLPRSSRLRPPRSRSWRAELGAALGVALVLAHLLFAQVTLVLLVLALVTGAISRWRPLWLAVPAAAGALWVAAIGTGRALADFTAGPRQVAASLAGAFDHQSRLGQLPGVFGAAGHWLPRQLPVALLAAAAEAAAAGWLAGLGRPPGQARGQAKDRASGWTRAESLLGPPGGAADAEPGYRRGLIVAIRGRRSATALAAGQVVTATGCAVGLDTASGRFAEVSWAQAEGGVLTVGTQLAATALACFPLAAAAIRRRKAVIAIDLTGSSWLARSLSAECAAAAAPLDRFGPAGPGCYEPLRGQPPDRAAQLTAQMLDWTGVRDDQRQACERYLTDLFAVLATVSRRPAATLDGLLALLDPAGLRDALGRVPGQPRQRGELARRVSASAVGLGPEQAALAALSDQLRRLRSSSLGSWLRAPVAPPRAGAQQVVSIGRAVRNRGCVLFSVDRARQPESADMVAGLAVADLTAVLAGLRDLRLRADCLVWLHGCEPVHQAGLAALLELGHATGTAIALSTTSAAAVAQLAPAAGVVITSGPVDRAVAAAVAPLGPFREEAGQQAVADLLRWQDEDELAVLARRPTAGFLPGCRSVPGPWAAA